MSWDLVRPTPSTSRSMLVSEKNVVGTKRKHNGDGDGDNEIDELEIDIHAPEPASKKALRKAKRAKATSLRDSYEGGSVGRAHLDKVVETPSPKQSSRRSPHGIWIGNLPFFINVEELQAFLTGDSGNAISSSQITRIHLPQGPPRAGSRFQNKGFAYIDLQSAGAVQTALNLSEKLFGGRRVLIKSSQNFQGRPGSASKTAQVQEGSSKRIFVGNLDFDITKEDLERHFSICGEVENSHVATFQDSGKCKGYAWVQFEHLTSAEAAMRGWIEVKQGPVEEGDALTDPKKIQRGKKRLWTKVMDGRKLRMEYAEDKATRYKKRFGKAAHSEEAGNNVTANPSTSKSINPRDSDRVLRSPNAGRSRKTPAQVDTSATDLSGYSAATVQKITGAITEGQGSKITFD